MRLMVDCFARLLRIEALSDAAIYLPPPSRLSMRLRHFFWPT
jgi:hypothetical protein